MFHNEWSAEAAKPFNILREQKRNCNLGWCGVPVGSEVSADTDCRSVGDGKCREPSSAICDKLHSWQPSQCEGATPGKQVLEGTGGPVETPGVFLQCGTHGDFLPNVRSANWGVRMDAFRMQSRRSVSLHTGSSYRPCPPLHPGSCSQTRC